MAIKFLTTSNGLRRTTNLVQGSAASHSWFVWFRPDTNLTLGEYQTVIASEGAANNYEGVYTDNLDSDKYKLELNNNAGSGDQSTAGITLVAGQWYPISFHRSGAFSQWEVSTIGTTTLNFNMAAAVYTFLFLGWDGAGQNRGTFAYFREWTFVMSPTQFRLEANSRVAVQTTGLITDTPLTSNLLDLTVAHNDWTAPGVLNTDYQFVSDDPIPAGCVASDPIVISSLPYVNAISIKPTNVEFIFNQWFKYTAVAPEVYIGGWLSNDPLNITPKFGIYSDAGITQYPPHNPIHNAQQRRFQIPVTASNSYWFETLPFFVNLTTGTVLNVDFVTGPHKAIPSGSAFINDDLEDFYAALISMVDGDDYNVLEFRPFAVTNAEQGGDAFINKNIVCIDDVAGKVKIYNSNLAEVLDTGLVGNTSGCIRSLASGEASYSGYNLIVNRIDKNGVVGPTTWHPTGSSIAAMAASNDETKLYINPAGGNAPNAPVKVWDLAGAVYLADLAAGIAQNWVQNIMVLADDSILVYYFRSVGTPFDFKVIRYSPAGAILNTYTFPVPLERTGNAAGNLAYDFFDPANYFLIRIHGLVLVGGTSLLRVRLSDGVIVSQVDHVRFQNGLYQGPLTATPLTKFGPSQSCPFFAISPMDKSGIYYIHPTKDTKHDSYYNDVEKKIPDPTIKTALIGE